MAINKLQKLLNNVPNQVRITKSISYEIVFIDEFPNGKTLGECRFDTKQIVINKNQSVTEQLKVILHETIHAIDMENEIGLTENHVLGLEEGIFRFLKLNKLLDKI